MRFNIKNLKTFERKRERKTRKEKKFQKRRERKGDQTNL
jgi:hypothetical protein